MRETFPRVEAGQTVWCRTADGEWWKTTAGGPATRSVGRPSWLAIPVLGWDPDDPGTAVNWPAAEVVATDPAMLRTFGSPPPKLWSASPLADGGDDRA